jgi:hypothetical protein
MERSAGLPHLRRDGPCQRAAVVGPDRLSQSDKLSHQLVEHALETRPGRFVGAGDGSFLAERVNDKVDGAMLQV